MDEGSYIPAIIFFTAFGILITGSIFFRDNISDTFSGFSLFPVSNQSQADKPDKDQSNSGDGDQPDPESQPVSDQPTEQSSITPQKPDPDVELDKEKWKRTNYSLNFSMSADGVAREQSRLKGSKLKENNASWKEYIGDSTSDMFIDPYTNTQYNFTQNTPNFGEIQLKLEKSCNRETHEFAPPRIHDNFAFRVRFRKTGVRCITNF
jgi:hypothetical protein